MAIVESKMQLLTAKEVEALIQKLEEKLNVFPENEEEKEEYYNLLWEVLAALRKTEICL